MSFSELGVPAGLCAVLDRAGILTPFPIQTATLPDTLTGCDVLGRGRTGSGKTLAFALPMVARLAASAAAHRRAPNRPRSLILAPTRELATQIAAVIEPLAIASKLTVSTIFGGVPQGRQVSALRSGLDILIACPGRLEDLIKQGHCRLDAVEITVLDEADHMADLGFLPAVRRLLDATPKVGQRMLFSATLDNGVDVLVRRFLNQPLTHSVDSAVAPVAPMSHHVFAVRSIEDKATVVRELASGQGRRLLFTRTKHGAKKLAKQLTAAGVPAVDLHGNLSQNARERNLSAFMTGAVRVLVATDIAARGIHVDEIELVVHVDPPTEHKAYLHRSGRTARAGAGGDVVTVMLPEQHGDVRTMTRQAGITPLTRQVAPGSEHTRELVGAFAAHVQPAAPQPAHPARRTPSSGGRRGSSRPKGSPRAPARVNASAPARGNAGAPARGNAGAPAPMTTRINAGAGAVAASRAGGSRRRSAR